MLVVVLSCYWITTVDPQYGYSEMEDETVNQQMIILTSLKSLPHNIYTFVISSGKTIAPGIFQKEEFNGKLPQATSHQ